MSISREEVARVARLAHLDLDDEELDRLAGELGQVLALAARLPALPEDGGDEAGEGPLREDRIEASLEDAVKAAPDSEGNLFRVPPAIRRDEPS